MPKKLMHDNVLLVAVALLIGIGIVMIYSASAIIAFEKFRNSYFFIKRQIFWVVLGLGVLFVSINIDYWNWRKWIPLIMGAGFILLIAVLIPPFGQNVRGTRRWIRIGVLSLQPSELIKVPLILYIADFLDRRKEKVEEFFFGFLPPLLITCVISLLILMQPDLGSSLALVAIVFTMMFAGGVKISQLILIALLSIPLIASAIYGASYRHRRIVAYINPWEDPLGSGFQIIQSFIALGSGGIFGRGLGESKQKLFYLPDAHTDFIFSIIGEELGLIGLLVILALFSVVIWRGFRIALSTQDNFGAILALGLTSMIAIQSIINIGVVVGLLPSKGLPLPFLSFGGSSLISSLLSVGILLNISQHCIIKEKNV